MTNSSVTLTKAEVARIREHVERVLGSQTLVQADRLRRFLEYIVNHELSGQAGKLNQFSIALDVFDRDESFDPAIDAIVRVEAGRLRSKLLEYYDEEGRNDSVKITLPKRGYAVKFEFRETQTSTANDDFVERKAISKPLKPVNITNPTVAVLPFDNMSTDPEQEYFSDGITEDLITDLSRLPGLSVIARQSTFVYKGVATDTKEISAHLGADFIVEGSVRKIGSRIRINVQLIHGETGKHSWAERFDREIDDIFVLQDSVNRKIVDALKLQISTANQSRSQYKGTAVVEAYDYVLRGMKEDQARTREGSARARYCFRSALELDPDYASAYGRLGMNAIYEWIAGWSDSREETVDEGLNLARKAVALDSENAFAFAALCWALLWKGKHIPAIEAGQKAISLDPNDVTALERLALTLAFSGRAEEGLQYLEKAQTLTPLNSSNFPNAVCCFMLERYSAAVENLHSSINANPTFLPSYLYLAVCLSLLGQEDAAAPVVKSIRELAPNFTTTETRHSVFKRTEDRERFFGALTRLMGP